MTEGTHAIAQRFDAIASSATVNYSTPAEAVPSWLPVGYALIQDPGHVLRPNDAIKHALSTDWRLVKDINEGSRIGLRVDQAGKGIIYAAAPSPKYQVEKLSDDGKSWTSIASTAEFDPAKSLLTSSNRRIVDVIEQKFIYFTE